MNSDIAWADAVESTRKRSPSTFEQWFSGVQFDGLEEGCLNLVARDEFVRDWVHAHYLDDLLGHLRVSLGVDSIRVSWRVDRDIATPVAAPQKPSRSQHPLSNSTRPASLRPPPPSEPTSNRPRLSVVRSERPSGGPSRVQLDPKFVFENFVVGASNELAYAAARAAAGGGGLRYNPLFIAGGTGLGKTHLVHAIAHQVLEARPTTRVVYVSAERFTNEFIESLQNRRMDDFRHRFRAECDLLLVDDIQFLAGREQTQEEFFHTFNALRDQDCQIVVTADKYPQQLQRMPERLVSRFTSGLVADVQVPQLETRVAIVRKKAALEGIDVPDAVALLLAQCVKTNVRELEGALIRLAAKSSLIGCSINEEFAERELLSVGSRRPDTGSVQDIQNAVSGHFRITNADLVSKDRHKSVAFARQVAMYLCRQRLKCSFPELGRAFGNRDHTTVMSAVRRVEALLTTDPQVAAHLEAIESELARAE